MDLRYTFEQALALQKAGKLEDAEKLYRSIVEGRPGIGNDAKPYAGAAHHLGVICVSTDRFDEAVQWMERSVALRPREAQYQRNLAVTLINGGRPQDMSRGMAAAQVALQMLPQDVVLLEFFARAAAAVGQTKQAADAWRRIAELLPDNALVHLNAGLLAQQCGDVEAAIASYQTVLRLQPQQVDAMANLASLMGAIRGPAEAFALLEELEALGKMSDALKPLHAYLLVVNGQIGRAEKALEAVPVGENSQLDAAAHAFALQSLPYIAAAKLGMGELEDALAVYSRYYDLQPNDVHAFASHASTAQYVHPDNPDGHLTLHRRFERDVAASIAALPAAAMSPLATRRLRVGYVSGDLRAHPVGFFIEPLLLNHDNARVEVHLFNNSHRVDATSLRMKAKAAGWHDVVLMSDDELARLVRRLQIDVLIDLSGHTGSARLPMFAQRPAPVQLTYLGYSSTTGMDAIDGLITDEVCDPPANDAHFNERLLRLPQVMAVFRPPMVFPDVSPPPAQTAGRVTLGAVSALKKINDAVLDAWSAGLRDAPAARLMMVAPGLGDPMLQDRFRTRFARRGIDPSRVSFTGALAFEKYIALHSEIDLMLDTFPFTGHTTTVQNLWMGVPVVTFAGTSHRARMAASVLTSIGLSELIAHREEDYGSLIARWANDPSGLAELRSGMRQRMLASPLMDEQRFARDFEDLLFKAYETKRETGHV